MHDTIYSVYCNTFFTKFVYHLHTTYTDDTWDVHEKYMNNIIITAYTHRFDSNNSQLIVGSSTLWSQLDGLQVVAIMNEEKRYGRTTR